MLSHKILTRQDIGRVANYYEDSADDYYAKDGDASQWQGKGVKALGLSGSVESEKFRQLLAGEVKIGANTRIATRQDSKQRIGIDFTFSAPKSVSIQSLVAGDSQIIKAHDKAVQKAIDATEVRAQARKKINGKSQVENTGNLIVAKFRHETSREQDPQLHTHAVIMNLTKRSDGEWRALRNDEIVKMTKYLGAVYRSELASELQKLGYSIRHEPDGMFELAHISRAQLEGFSVRSQQIEAKLSEQGLSRETATQTQKQQATLQTRAYKVSTEREILFQIWCTKANELGINFDNREWSGHNEKNSETDRTLQEYTTAEAATRAVKFAIHHLTERQAIVDNRTLIDTAMKQAIGNANLIDVENAIQAQIKKGFLIPETPLYVPVEEIIIKQAGKTKQAWINEFIEKWLTKTQAHHRVQMSIQQGSLTAKESRYTTQTALKREKIILNIEKIGREAVPALLPIHIVEKSLASEKLNEGQRKAIELIATTQNKVIGIQGFAGTGKSHMLNTAKKIIEKEGYQIRALAPYGSQVKALRELGVESNTLVSFLHAKDKNINEKTVLVLDEAGVVPTRLMEQTLKLVEKTGARIVLIGDTAQTKAIEAGRPFDQLQASGMATAHMEEIQRQKNPLLKEAVELAARGNTHSSLQKISSILELKDDYDRHRIIVENYVNLSEKDREQTIIVSGTNKARRNINKMVREHTGTLGKGLEFNTLIRRDSTQAERRFSKNYHFGDVIQPEKDYKKIGLKRGELYKITDTGPGNRLTVLSECDKKFVFNPMNCNKISVYQAERNELAKGDIVRITRNNAQLDLVNGDRMKIESVTPYSIELSNGKRHVTLSTEKPLHIDYAYATTVHSSQGLTAERVLVDIKTNSLTTSKDVYYVAVSRARMDAYIYTDNIQKLPEMISRDNVKHAAFDLQRLANKSSNITHKKQFF